MTVEIKAPQLPESVPDGTIATWYKNVGDSVSRDEPLVDIETDKVVIEVVAPADGVLTEILKDSGETIVSNEAIANIEAGAAAAAAPAVEAAVAEASAAATAPAGSEAEGDSLLSPAARKMAEENNLDVTTFKGTGKDGRVTKEDVVHHLSGQSAAAVTTAPAAAATGDLSANNAGRIEERVPMSRLRAKVAERLLTATQTTAMLTTFNEVNMQPVMDIRNRYKEEFERTHNGVRLG
ncbi:MAG TPA: dihydrolipoamide succinyltransferase, partial [Gammaproteobacteria bacterium]|nr:dihydrolipoamide succinyltransferase [Gammaproteobacteria bacterium]